MSDVVELQYAIGGAVNMSALTTCQLTSMDPDRNGVIGGADIQYLLRVVTKKYRFMKHMHIEYAVGVIDVSSFIFDDSNSPVDLDGKTDVQFSFAGGVTVLSSASTSVNDTNIVEAFSVTDGSAPGAFMANGSIPDSFGADYEVAVILYTYDAFGETSVSRQFAFYCSPSLDSCVSVYGAGASAYKSFFSFSVIGTPSNAPSSGPTKAAQTRYPTSRPSLCPSGEPSGAPTLVPSGEPSGQPTGVPTPHPTRYPTLNPTLRPTRVPTANPTNIPTKDPTSFPTGQPTSVPSISPTTIIDRLAPISIGDAETYVVMAATDLVVTVAGGGGAVIFGGDIGANSGTLVHSGPAYSYENAVGFDPYTEHINDATAHLVFADIEAAYDDGWSRTIPPPADTGTSITDGTTFTPGLFESNGDLSITGVITLDGSGVDDAMFIFRVTGNLDISADIMLTNGASVFAVYFLVEGSITINAPVSDKTRGVFIAGGDIVVGNGFVSGKVFSTGGSVSVSATSFASTRKTFAPTEHPTSAPSINFYDYETQPIYQRYLIAREAQAAVNNTLSFGTFTYKGTTVSATSASVDNVTKIYSDSLSLPFDYLFFSKLVATVEVENFETDASASEEIICEDEALIKLYIGYLKTAMTSLNTASNQQMNCDGRRWKVYTCSGSLFSCIDCDMNADPCNTKTCPGSNRWQLAPLQKDCLSETKTAASSVLQFSIGTKILYPQFNGTDATALGSDFPTAGGVTPLAVDVTRSTALVTFMPTLMGTMYCAALPASFTLLSTATVKQAGVSLLVDNATHVMTDRTILITSLKPETTYNVYCYTEDFNNHFMPLSLVLSSGVNNVVTECCRSILITSTVKEIPDSLSTDAPTFFTFQIDTLPTAATTVTVSVAAVACSNVSGVTDGFVSTTAVTVQPSSFAYTATSQQLSNSFKVTGLKGCYSLSIDKTSGPDTYTGASLSPFLYIRDSTVPPSPPVLSSAIFSDDGRTVVVNLDSAGDRGESIGLANFAGAWTCSDLLEFTGSSGSLCQWTSNKKITVSQGSPTPLATVTLRALKLRPPCLAEPIGVHCGYGAPFEPYQAQSIYFYCSHHWQV